MYAIMPSIPYSASINSCTNNDTKLQLSGIELITVTNALLIKCAKMHGQIEFVIMRVSPSPKPNINVYGICTKLRCTSENIIVEMKIAPMSPYRLNMPIIAPRNANSSMSAGISAEFINTNIKVNGVKLSTANSGSYGTAWNTFSVNDDNRFKKTTPYRTIDRLMNIHGSASPLRSGKPSAQVCDMLWFNTFIITVKKTK